MSQQCFDNIEIGDIIWIYQDSQGGALDKTNQRYSHGIGQYLVTKIVLDSWGRHPVAHSQFLLKKGSDLTILPCWVIKIQKAAK